MGADLQDLGFESRLQVFRCSGFHSRGRDVLLACDCIAHAAQGIAKAGNSHGRWAHVGAAPAGAQVEWHTNDPHRAA